MRRLYPKFNKNIFSSFTSQAIRFPKLHFLFIVFLVAGLNSYAQPGAAWEYSRTISLSAPTPLNNYQVQITLTPANTANYTDMTADGRDLQFYVGATACSFWIEKYDNFGNSIIWVNVPVSGTNSVTMYYGNPAATTGSNGNTTFDFFDDFLGSSLAANWSTYTNGGTITVAGGQATLSNSGDRVSMSSAFSPTSPSFIVEIKNKETAYYRNRFYATSNTVTASLANNDNSPGTGDYGYFGAGGNSSTARCYPSTVYNLTANTDYLTRWDITDGSNYQWSNYYYLGVQINPTNTYTVTAPIRTINIGVSENTAATIVDWVRVRKGTVDINNNLSLGPQVQIAPIFTSFIQNAIPCSGIGSITAVITGDNFDHASSVTFNGVAAQSFTVDSRTQITAISQTGVTGGVINIVTPGGNVSTTSINVQPLPTLFTVGGGGSYCAGGTGLPITLSGSENGISYQLLQDATAGGSPITGNGSSLIFPNQTVNAAYTVLATNTTTGCTQTMTGAPTIVINPLPTAYNVTGAGNFCSGGAGLAVGLDGSQAGVNYQLLLGGTPVGMAKPGTGSAFSFGNQITAGTYTVTANYATGTTCSSNMVGSAVVTVNPLPTGTIAVTETSGNGPANDGKICVGDAITFTAPPGYSSYTFKLNGTPVSPQPGSNVYTTSSLIAGTPIVTVDVTDGNGCHATLNTVVPVSVNTLPTGTFAPDVNNVCPGTKVIFNAPTGYSIYVFKVNGGSPVNTASISSYSYTTLANGDVVSVDVTNSNGCMKTFTSTAMIIKPLPGAAGSIAGTTVLCAGTNNVTYSVPSIANATSYTWTLPPGASFVGGSTGSTITVNFSNTATTGNITVAGVNGCGNGPASAPFQVIVNPLPVATIAGTTTLCQNAAAPTITFTGSNGTAPYTFSYNINGGATQTAFSTGNTATLNAPTTTAGTFTYNLISVKDASSTTCTTSITIASAIVTVNPIPLTPAALTGISAVCQNTSAVAYSVAPITYADPAGYHWAYSGTGATINGTSNNITIDFAANATSGDLTVYGQNSCGVGTVSATYHINVNPLPTATITNDANSAECQNSPIKPGVVFTGSGGTAPYTFTYTVNGTTQTVSTTSGNSVTAYQPTTTAGPFTYVLVSVQDNSSTHCANPQAGSVSVTIHSLPLPVLTGPDQICPNDVSDYATQTGQSNYIWTINGGALNSGGGTSDPTAQVHWNNDNLPKSIYVNYTDGNGCSGNTSVSVVSTSPTTPAFNSSGPKIVCLNSTGNIYEVQSDPTYSDYVWSITGGTITSGGGLGGSTTDNTATVTWNTAGPQTISVNFNSGLCSAPAPTAYPVTVNTLPRATVSTNNATVCQNGSSPIITFTGADGAANYTFSYTINGVAQPDIVSSGNSQTATVPTGTAGDYIYKLTNVADNNTCSQVQTNAVTVTVNPLPLAAISGTAAVCVNSPQPLITFTGSVGTAPYTFTYTINGGANQIVTTTSGNSVTVAAPTGIAGNYAYTLVSVKDANGCTQTAAGTATITINPLPTATMTGPSALCLNDAANITFTGSNGTQPYVFTYTIDGGANQSVVTTSGNTVTVGITTTSAHTFTYKLISVQDGSTTACVQNQAGTVSVIVSPVSVGGTLTGTATVCTPTNSGTITLGADKVGNVIRWESSIDGGTTWSSIANVTSSLNYTNLTTTTQYRAIIQSGTCIEAASNAATITVNTANGGTVTPGPSGTGTICAGSPGSVLLVGNSGSVLQWEYSTNGGTTWIVDATKHDAFYNFINISPTYLSQTTWFRALTQATPCAAVYSTVQKETVNPRPGATITGSPNPVCIGGSTTLTLNLTGSGAMTGIVTDGTNNYPFSGTSANPVVLTGITPATSTSYTISTLSDANCVSTGATYLPNFVNITVNPLPAPVVITPGNTTICSGSILPLSSVENHAGNFTFTQTSSPNIAIPDNNPSGASNAISVPAGTIPVGGVVDSVQVTLNVQHPEVNDLSINLGSPDGKIITLAAYSLYGPNLTNTNISSRTSQYPVVTTGSSPYTGTYSAEGDNLYGAEVGNANTRKFTDLFGTTLAPPNGNWTLYLTDNWAGNTGTLQNWTLTVYYHVPVNPVDIVWSPLDSLFTDPSATIPYTGDARQTVYAKPSATTTYTGQAEDANSCTTASNVTITVTPAPVVSVIADYCSVPNKVQLTASSVPAASSYVWNTGETTNVIAVDEAKLYTVAATTGLHCVGTGFLSIAQELVKNGDFESGNTAFYTQYGFVAPGGSLQPEGLYAVDTNAHNYHNNFFGKDHTTPAQTGKFMIVNGYPGTGIIWQETVSVLPNTNYYYSAWAMNLNNVAPHAVLQFSVNGVPVGTAATNGIADLSTAPEPTTTGGVNINNWVRFYYGNTNGWFSGSATTAVIQIIDLNTQRAGNDFGLDDISFATLSTFITLTSPTGTDNQTVCRGDKITDITYSVGSGGTPTVTGLPNGLTYDFKNGITLAISGTPNDNSGVYTYTITTTGACSNPTTATGQITVKGQKVTLSSLPGTDAQIVCKGTPITPIKYTLSELATNAVVTGLPTGVTAGPVTGNVITITGSPVDSGTFTYKIVTTGASCNADSLTGTIRSNVQTIQKTSGDDNQALCINNKMGDIIYTISGTGGGASAVGLPSGVTGGYAGGNFTISGKPTVSGVFNYTITTSGTCEAAAITGTITVSADATVSLSSPSGSDAQIICYNGVINNITYNTSGAPDAGVTVTGLPDGVNYSVNSGIVTITGTPTESGSFTYTVKATGSCVEASTTGTITIDALVNTGTSFTTDFAQLCSAPSGTLTLNGSSGTIKGWQYSTDAGVSWLPTSPVSTTNVLNFTINSKTYFRVVFDGGACGDSYSSPYVIGIHNLWTGEVSTDWNDANNWSDGNIPSVSCPDVVIPQVPSNNYPVLATGTATINNLQIKSNASLMVNGTGIFQVAGNVTNAGVFDATAATIDFNGTSSAQVTDGSTFKNNTIQNLIVSNANGLSVAATPGDTMKISGSLTFGDPNANINTGNNVTLLSTASATANVGVLNTGNSITGSVTVERYVAAINNWQFLAVPTQTTQTIHQAWQENQAPGAIGQVGYGTNVTGPTGTGFDFISPNPSMKYWDNPTQAYINITNTNIQFPNIKNGFFLFIRGDRQATASASSTKIPTVMRTTGILNTGSISFSIPANYYYSLGNPYASRVDFRNVAGIAGIGSTFYVWDPLISGYYGAGGYQTFSAANGYIPLVPTAYYLSGVPYPYLESGQAVFLNNTSGSTATITFNESAKTTGSHLVFRGGASSPSQFFRTYLYASSGKVADGNVVAFNSQYQNRLDVNDAIKIYNTGENLSLKRQGIMLSIEARSPVTASDTIYFDMKNVSKQTYHFQFSPENMGDDGLKAYLVDNYLRTKTEVSLGGVTSSDFTVNSDAASYAADRFMIVFKQSTQATVLPITFVSLAASQKDKNILVEWNVQNEHAMLQYDVEKSIDAINFVKKATVPANNSGSASYQWTDKDAAPGNNYYRIRSVDKDGKTVYSTVVTVLMSNFKSSISIYPNPITDGIIHLQFVNQQQGRYGIRLLNPLGQLIVSKQIEFAGGNGSEGIKWDYNLAHGVYQLEILKPDRNVEVIRVMY